MPLLAELIAAPVQRCRMLPCRKAPTSVRSQRVPVQVAVNWGLAALVYGFVGGFIARMLARAAVGGYGGRRATTV